MVRRVFCGNVVVGVGDFADGVGKGYSHQSACDAVDKRLRNQGTDLFALGDILSPVVVVKTKGTQVSSRN